MMQQETEQFQRDFEIPRAGSAVRQRAASAARIVFNSRGRKPRFLIEKRSRPGLPHPAIKEKCCPINLRFVSRRRGFTLLELMLAMIIVATLIPVLYSAMHAAFSAKTKAEAAVEPARTAELSLDILRQDLSMALAPTGQLAYTFQGTDGKDDRGRDGDDLQFCSTADSPQHGAANGEVKYIELAIMTAPNGDHVLVRKVFRNLLSPQESASQVLPPGNPDVEVICRGVGGFNLRYFDGTNWNDTWDCTAEDYTVPAAVEVTLTLDRANGTSTNSDGSHCFRYLRVIALACSTAASDSTVNSGTLQ